MLVDAINDLEDHDKKVEAISHSHVACYWKNINKFVTWVWAFDGKGRVVLVHGHYFEDKESMLEDFSERII